MKIALTPTLGTFVIELMRIYCFVLTPLYSPSFHNSEQIKNITGSINSIEKHFRLNRRFVKSRNIT